MTTSERFGDLRSQSDAICRIRRVHLFGLAGLENQRVSLFIPFAVCTANDVPTFAVNNDVTTTSATTADDFVTLGG